MSSRDGEIFTPLVFGGRPAIPVTRTVRDAPDHLWVGSGVEGLFSVRLDSAGHAVGWEHYPRSDRFGAISSDEIHCMWVDRSRVLWVGTRLGLNMANISPPEFYTFTPLLRSGYSVLGSNGRVINALFIDRSERLWINSMYDGTFRYDFRSGRLEDISRAVTSSSVSRIIQTRDGTIWVAAQEGVWRITEDSRGVLSKRLLRLPGIPVGVASHYRYFLDLIEDGAGDLWIATVDGLIRYSPRTDLAATYTRAHGLASSSAYCLAADASRNIIWMGSSDRGISRIVYRDDSPEIEVQLLSSDTYPFGLGCDQVWALHLDQDGVLWIGTDAGFYRMDAASGISEAIRITAPYLDDAKIVAIIADRQGDLWLNSNQGLYRHTPSTGSTRRYIREDRLQSDTWTEGAACSSDGWIFVGGVNGVNYFNPALFVPNAYAGRPLLTGMKIFNRPVEVGKEYDGRVTLDRSLNVVDRVALSYRQNNFTLEFSSDHYATPSKNRFRYRLEGYDGDWIEVGAGQRFASYARLPSGNYTFIIGKTKCAKNQNEVRQKNLSAPLFFR
jgi:ligand-binding sensor domain-containing protein